MVKENGYRDFGAKGALLDEYEKTIQELKSVIYYVNPTELEKIVDVDTDDKDCRSIQTILAHVIRAGYGYAIQCRISFGENLTFRTTDLLPSVDAYIQGLDQMFAYNVQLFLDYPDMDLESFELEDKMKVTWGQLYDVEQIFEHAIVHILRHRRQIERFLLKLRA